MFVIVMLVAMEVVRVLVISCLVFWVPFSLRKLCVVLPEKGLVRVVQKVFVVRVVGGDA